MKNHLKEIPHKNYKDASLNELVNYAIGIIGILNKEIIFEDIVVATYILFPKKFSLVGYNEYPDSVRTNRRIVDLRDRGFIVGSVAKGYKQTTKGQKEFERVDKIFKLGKSINTKSKRTGRKNERNRASRFIKHIKQSDAYKKFKPQNDVSNISEYEFRSLLMCPMESPPTALRQSLSELKQQVATIGNDEILEFLEKCNRNFIKILHTKYADDEIGGMIKQKAKKR